MKHNQQQRWGSIYRLTAPNGKYYFGKTIHFKERMSEHRRSAKKCKTYFARAIKKHGWENFNVEILIRDVPEEDLDNLERSYIEIYDSMNPKKGYNLTKGGEGTSGWVPSQEYRNNHSKRIISNRSQFGTVSYLKSQKVYTVHGPKDGNRKRTYVGQYDSKEEATNALEIFNKTGKKTPSDRCGQFRKKGSGSICFTGKLYECFYQDKYIGSYDTKKAAEKAIQHFIQTGETLPSGHKRKTGCIRKENGRFRADFKGTYIGYYVSKEKAEEALRHFIETGEKLKSTIQRRKGSIHKRKSRFQASYSRKYLGTYSSEQEAEEAIKKHLSTAHTATASTTTSV